MLNGSLFSVGALGQGSLLVAKSAGNISELTKGANHYVLKVNGNALVWEEDAMGVGASPGGSDGYLQFKDGSSFAGNGGLTFTKATKTISIANDAPLDINSTSVSIADDNISFDSGSGVTFSPANNQNLNVNLGGTGNFSVETNRFVVVNNGNVGIKDSTPDGLLDVNGSFMLNGSLFSVGALGQGSLLVAKSAGNISELTKGTNHYVLKVNGNALV